MFRYIAFAWNVSSKDAAAVADLLTDRLRATSPELQAAIDTPGLRVFCAGARPGIGEVHRFWNHPGAILGTLFERNADLEDDTTPSTPILDARATASILSTAGRRLVTDYWGSYVAILQDSSKRKTRFLRGPMSELACFYTAFRGVSLVFSRMEDCARLGLLQFTIDWNAIAMQVGFGAFARVGESTLKEVSSLERGECIETFGAEISKSVYWDPVSVARSDAIENPQQVVSALRATTRSSVRASTCRYEAVLLRLSGGFDSSVLLCCLRGTPPQPVVTCVNFYSQGAMEDERTFARAVARHTQSELIERERGHHADLAVIKNVVRTAAPIQDTFDWQEHVWEHQLARDRGASAILMGALGDTLFERNAHLSPAADYVYRHGIGRALVSVAFDVARHRNVSIWKVLSSAVRDAWIRPPRGAWSIFEARHREGILKADAFLTCADELRRNTHLLVHPWLRAVDGVSPGKVWQIAMLPAESFYETHFRGPGDPPIVAPFISQPLTELCLRIPTYMSVKGGWERAMARRAFAQDLPPELLRRTTKGSAGGVWLQEVIDRNARFIRGFLLDGLLVRQKVLDRDKLENGLPGTPRKTAINAGMIMNALYTEAWARAWSTRAAPQQEINPSVRASSM